MAIITTEDMDMGVCYTLVTARRGHVLSCFCLPVVASP